MYRYGMILALQETTSWDVDNLCLAGFFFEVCKTGSTMLLVSSRICDVQKLWSTEERCMASVIVNCVYAPDSAKDFEEYEKFMGELSKVMKKSK